MTYHVVVGLLTHQSSEGYNRRNAGEVEKDDGGETLRVETVREVADEEAIAAPNISDKSSEDSRITKKSFSKVQQWRNASFAAGDGERRGGGEEDYTNGRCRSNGGRRKFG